MISIYTDHFVRVQGAIEGGSPGRWGVTACETPQQDNLDDCGLYMLELANRLVRCPPPTIVLLPCLFQSDPRQRSRPSVRRACRYSGPIEDCQGGHARARACVGVLSVRCAGWSPRTSQERTFGTFVAA